MAKRKAPFDPAKAAATTNSVLASISASATRSIEPPPDPEEMNDDRSDAAAAALDAYTDTRGERGNGLEVQNLTDLVTSFGHFCDRNDIDFADILRRAQYHYNEETDNEGTQKFSAVN